jgi:signal transduction histidine kinase
VNLLPNDIRQDIARIDKISVVPTILEMICRTTSMGFAAVARVSDSHWVACSVRDEIGFGLKPGGELKIETTICDEIRQSGKGVIIDHVSEDEQYRDHHTPAMYGFQSYISLPIFRRDGSFFGTLCAIDPKPARLNNPDVTNMFRMYSDLISFHLEAVEQLERAEQQLNEEHSLGGLREQFIAILGHDLKNPIGAIMSSAQLLTRTSSDEKILRLARIIADSSFRMKGLVDNLLDFARGRLGGGFQLDLNEEREASIFLQHVVSELQAMRPDATIESRFEMNHPVSVDRKRISQLFSNLLANAVSYGKPGHPVMVEAVSRPEGFFLDVSNAGERIPESSMPLLFQPFSRGKVQQGQDGLGLGLYIASEIAKAHGGNLTAVSNDEQTKFSFRMPQR